MNTWRNRIFIENLHDTHTGCKQLVPVRSEIEIDTIHVAWQSGGPHQQHNKNQIGKCCSEIHSLKETVDYNTTIYSCLWVRKKNIFNFTNMKFQITTSLISCLAKCLHTLDEYEVDNYPCDQQREHNFALETTHVMQAIGDVQHMITEDSDLYICWRKV